MTRFLAFVFVTAMAAPAVFSAFQEGGAPPASLERLCDSSVVIADAYVDSVFPSGTFGSAGQHMETDAVFRITRTFKGSGQQTQVVLSQFGQNPKMAVGQHYILFLQNETVNRLNLLPVRLGIPRYAPTYQGLFQADRSTLRLNNAVSDGLRTKYDGKDPVQLIADVESYLRRSRLQLEIR